MVKTTQILTCQIGQDPSPHLIPEPSRGFGFDEGAFISAPVSLLPLPANNGNQTITHEARHILALLAFVASFV
jgi:hypothetical protein